MSRVEAGFVSTALLGGLTVWLMVNSYELPAPVVFLIILAVEIPLMIGYSIAAHHARKDMESEMQDYARRDMRNLASRTSVNK